MNYKISYDYDELINELKLDLETRVIELDDLIKVKREPLRFKDNVSDEILEVQVIIDYDYINEYDMFDTQEEIDYIESISITNDFVYMKVKDVLNEMIEKNAII